MLYVYARVNIHCSMFDGRVGLCLTSQLVRGIPRCKRQNTHHLYNHHLVSGMLGSSRVRFLAKAFKIRKAQKDDFI